MKIERILINNLYGYEYDVRFNKSLTILYGVNGSGKTTILDIIYLISSGNISSIFRYKFDSMKVEFDNSILEIISEKKCYEIIFTTENNIRNIELKKRNKDIVVNKDEFFNLQLEDEIKHVENIEQLRYSNELNIINKEIGREVELTYIPLNRKIKGSRNSSNLHPSRIPRGRNMRIKSYNPNEMFENTLQRANSYYATYEQRILKQERRVRAQLEKQIIEKMAEPIENIDLFTPLYDSKKINIEDIAQGLLNSVEGKVRTNMEKLLEIYLKSKDRIEYFKKEQETNKYINEIVKQQVSYFQIKKVYEVLESIKPHRKSIEKKRENLKRILDNINKLLKDTGKKVLYNDTQGLHVKNFKTQEDLQLDTLSSGEIQLIIFMVFSLVKNQEAGGNKLIMIDEPELSMHITWQEQLLPLMTEHITENSQMIIATHSPDVIGDMYDKCVEVKPT